MEPKKVGSQLHAFMLNDERILSFVVENYALLLAYHFKDVEESDGWIKTVMCTSHDGSTYHIFKEIVHVMLF